MLIPKTPSLGRVSAAQLLWLDSGIDADKIDYSVLPSYDSIEDMCKDKNMDFTPPLENSGNPLFWYDNPHIKPENYGY